MPNFYALLNSIFHFLYLKSKGLLVKIEKNTIFTGVGRTRAKRKAAWYSTRRNFFMCFTVNLFYLQRKRGRFEVKISREPAKLYKLKLFDSIKNHAMLESESSIIVS